MAVSLLIPIVLGVAGQLLLKYGMTGLGAISVDSTNWLPTAWRVFSSPYVVGGVLVYGISTVFWLLVLSKTELSYAYPFLSLSYVLIFVFSWLLFGEHITPVRVAGMLVICLGVVVLSRG